MKVATNQERLNQLFDSDQRTDSAIAAELGVSKQTISMWRHGTRSPKKSVLIKIADMYNVDIAWLMGYDVPKEYIKPDIPVFLPNNEKFTKIMANMTAQEYETVVRIFEKAYERIKEKGESL